MEQLTATRDKNPTFPILVVLNLSVKEVYYKSVDQESSLFLTMDSQTSSPVGPAA